MKIISSKPSLFEKTDNNIWTDPYIQQQMLKEHLNPDSDGASRKQESIHKIADFIEAHSKPQARLENPVQIDPLNQTNLTPCSKIRLTLLSKIKMTPLKCMST